MFWEAVTESRVIRLTSDGGKQSSKGRATGIYVTNDGA